MRRPPSPAPTSRPPGGAGRSARTVDADRRESAGCRRERWRRRSRWRRHGGAGRRHGRWTP
ncbi:hypothetical protein CA850_16575 [Micromonospora echinospora]|nr:hypothetical protein CA850_16575 [Micromonospora echinospora]